MNKISLKYFVDYFAQSQPVILVFCDGDKELGQIKTMIGILSDAFMLPSMGAPASIGTAATDRCTCDPKVRATELGNMKVLHTDIQGSALRIYLDAHDRVLTVSDFENLIKDAAGLAKSVQDVLSDFTERGYIKDTTEVTLGGADGYTVWRGMAKDLLSPQGSYEDIMGGAFDELVSLASNWVDWVRVSCTGGRMVIKLRNRLMDVKGA